MGKYFSDVVDKAIQDLDYCCDNDKAKAAADALLLAIEMKIIRKVTSQIREPGMPGNSCK